MYKCRVGAPSDFSSLTFITLLGVVKSRIKALTRVPAPLTASQHLEIPSYSRNGRALIISRLGRFYRLFPRRHDYTSVVNTNSLPSDIASPINGISLHERRPYNPSLTIRHRALSHEQKREARLSSYFAPAMQKLNARKLPARQSSPLHFFRQVRQSSFSLFLSFPKHVWCVRVRVRVHVPAFARPRPHQFRVTMSLK